MGVDILLDTGVCIDLMRSGSARMRFAGLAVGNRWQTVSIASITQFELENGINGRRGESAARATLETFLTPISVQSFDTKAAIEASKLAATARRMGLQLGGYDVLIAGVAIALGVPLVTTDKRLLATLQKAAKELEVVYWEASV